jgi:hypothetical protein
MMGIGASGVVGLALIPGDTSDKFVGLYSDYYIVYKTFI